MVQHRKQKKEERPPDPVLKLRNVPLEAVKVMEKDATEKNGVKYAPKVSIWWEIQQEGEHKGVRFWDNYSFVKDFDDENKYVIREGTRIGDLAEFVAYEFYGGENYFDSDGEIDFEILEGAKVTANLEPRRFKEGEKATGTRTVGTTLQLTERAEATTEKVGAVASTSSVEDSEDDWAEDIPF